MMNPQTLQRSVVSGFDRVENFRKARFLFLKEMAGAFYDQATPGEEQPLNLMFKAWSILIPHLVAKNPKNQVSSPFTMHRDYAKWFGVEMDDLTRSIRLKQTLRLTLTDALVAVGIIKVGSATTGQTIDLDDKTVNLSEPYADRVDLDNFGFDPQCRNFEEAVFLSERIQVPRAMVLETGLYPNDIIERLPGSHQNSLLGRSTKEVRRLSRSKRNLGTDDNQLMDYIDLVECYVPRENAIVTLPYGKDMASRDYLRVVEHQGPPSPTGPYKFLGFHWLPDNPMPVAPAGVWYDMHLLANQLASKAKRQAQRNKSVLAYQRSAAEDAQQIVEADDGDSVAVDNIAGITTVEFGKVSETLYQHLAYIDQKFAETGPGDLNQLGGESSDSGTATQATLLSQAASVRIGDMKDLLYDFTADVVQTLGWHRHNDPIKESIIQEVLPGNRQRTVIITPEMRQGDFNDFTFQVKQESMQRDDPAMKSQKLIQFVQVVIPTAIQTFLQLSQIGLGHLFNFIGFITQAAEDQGIDNFENIWSDPNFEQLIQEKLMEQQALGLMNAQGPGGAGVPGPAGSGTGRNAPGRVGDQGGNMPVGQDPTADPRKQQAQMGSAGSQRGSGNRTGLPGVATAGAL